MTGTQVVIVVIAIVIVVVVAIVWKRRKTSSLNVEAEPETVGEVVAGHTEPETDTDTEEVPQEEPTVQAVRFQRGWDQMELPLIGVVTVIDRGEPGVGLSAMQMNALGVGRGLVRLEFDGRTCEAKVWNAFGPDSLKGAAEIRITNSVARELGCGIDDEVKFTEVITANLPVQV